MKRQGVCVGALSSDQLAFLDVRHHLSIAESHPVKYLTFAVALFVFSPSSRGEEIKLTQPVDYQVIQRVTRDKGVLQIAGKVSAKKNGNHIVIEARSLNDTRQLPWKNVGSVVDGNFSGTIEASAGGWWQLEVRALSGNKEIENGSVAHFGVGEIFVIAGQSNSANHGEEKQTTKTRRVASFDGKAWRLADDPQPGASGRGGSFIPPFADAIVDEEDVPVGIIACGIGATSVREWLPEGTDFPNPPTILNRVHELPNGPWASNGDVYDTFINRMKSVGRDGFRAVLWHQGESDANQKDPTRTLSGSLYRDYLEKIIQHSRRDIGWQAPWFVAQASYHNPDDPGSDDIRAAQASLWVEGLAIQGPDSDAFKDQLRARGGTGVHFSGPGLRKHGAAWAAKVLPWLKKQVPETEQSN